MITVFLDVKSSPDRESALQALAGTKTTVSCANLYRRDVERFRALPNTAFLYFFSDRLIEIASEEHNLKSSGIEACVGFGGAAYFHRLRWEITGASLVRNGWWIRTAHGTPPAPFYKNYPLLVFWRRDGERAKADVLTRYPYLVNNYKFKIQNEEMIGIPGLSYGKRTNNFTVQILPAGCYFTFEGTAIHLDNIDHLWTTAAYLNSDLVKYWLNAVCAQHKLYPYVNQLPLPKFKQSSRLSETTQACFFAARKLSSIIETDDLYVLPLILSKRKNNLQSTLTSCSEYINDLRNEIQNNMRIINKIILGETGISEEEVNTEFRNSEEREEEDEEQETDKNNLSNTELINDFISWCVGVVFGRYDVRLLTTTRIPASELRPLEELPSFSPAILIGDDGLPAVTPPPGYPIDFPEDGILVDDPGHPRDLVAAVRRVFDVAFGPAADAWLDDVVRALDPRATDLRPWLATRLFDYHLKRHSMSRRKAPILWPLVSPRGKYRVWVAAHRATADTLHQVEATILKPRLDAATRLLEQALADAGPDPGRADREKIAAHEEMAAEVRALRMEVLRVAPFWKPDLDDGVVLAAAPLWRLVPVHRAWQRELKSKWAALAKGDYDWAHLAMHLWPERALRRCAADRSVAIAHDLEAEFWQEVRPDTWVARPADPARDARLLAARFSENRNQAVTAFIEAPGG